MKNRKVLLICAIVAVVAVSGVFVVAQADLSDLWFEAGKNAASFTADDNIVATVNGEAIYKSSLERLKTLTSASSEANMQMADEMNLSQEDLELVAKVPTDREMLDSLIENALKTQEAKKLGLSVSEQEISDYFSAYDKIVADSNTQNVSLVNDVMQSYCAGLGMTYDEYRSTIETDIVRDALLVEKLSERILQESDVKKDATIEDKNNVLSEYLDRLIETADIEVM